MIHVTVVCEGRTEQGFVSRVLAPALGRDSVFLQPRCVATSRGAAGGGLTGQRVLRFLRNTLREREDAYVTTFFDLYGLPGDFPGRGEAARESDPLARARAVERALHREAVDIAGCRPEQFLPHVQPYEFEALLLSSPNRLSKVEPSWLAAVADLAGALEELPSPEHLNDGESTHPSARLAALRPAYKKVRHSQALAEAIGLSRMREKCAHFDAWLTRLEALRCGVR